jgi:hypothetical protein
MQIAYKSPCLSNLSGLLPYENGLTPSKGSPKPLLRNRKVIFYRVSYYNNQANHYKIRRGRDMKLKNLLGSNKEPAVKTEIATKPEPVLKVDWKKKKEPAVKAEATKKWIPKPAGKGAKSRRRF